KSGVAEKDVARKRLEPEIRHGRLGAREQRRTLNPGRRTRVPSGNQSPAAPSAAMTRARIGPKAERPKLLSGSMVATAVLESSSTRLPWARSRVVLKLESAEATSTFSAREKRGGEVDLMKKTRWP